MELKVYDEEKNKYKNSEIVEGFFRNFDPKQDKISDFKLIFILQNGEYLLMPYLNIDNHDGNSEEYDHIVYNLKALELIIEKLGYNREKFIEEKIKGPSTDDSAEDFEKTFAENIISVFLNLNIAFLYNTSIYYIEENSKYMGAYLGKPLNLSERQKKAIAALKNSADVEEYEFDIMKLKNDNNLRNYEELNLFDSDFIQYLFGEDIKIDINTLFNIIDVDIEQQR